MVDEKMNRGRGLRFVLGLLFVLATFLFLQFVGTDPSVGLHALRFWPGVAKAQAGGSLSFTQVVDNLDYNKNTRMHAKQFLREQRGVPMVSEGQVVDVIDGRSRVKILVANHARPLIKGYNLVLTLYADREKSADLKKGQRIRFKGYFHNFKAGRYGGTIVYLDDCQLY